MVCSRPLQSFTDGVRLSGLPCRRAFDLPRQDNTTFWPQVGNASSVQPEGKLATTVPGLRRCLRDHLLVALHLARPASCVRAHDAERVLMGMAHGQAGTTLSAGMGISRVFGRLLGNRIRVIRLTSSWVDWIIGV